MIGLIGKLVMIATRELEKANDQRKKSETIKMRVSDLSNRFDLNTKAGITAAIAEIDAFEEKYFQDLYSSYSGITLLDVPATVALPSSGTIAMTFQLSKKLPIHLEIPLVGLLQKRRLIGNSVTAHISDVTLTIWVSANAPKESENLRKNIHNALNRVIKSDIRSLKLSQYTRNLPIHLEVDNLKKNLLAYAIAKKSA